MDTTEFQNHCVYPDTPPSPASTAGVKGAFGTINQVANQSADQVAKKLVAELCKQGLTLATAESLTGGLLSAAIVGVPGASNCFRGGLTTYQTAMKTKVLGVDATRLDQYGPVDSEVAQQMAYNACQMFAADVGIATTGVAGPGPSDGHAAGTVFISVWVERIRTHIVRQFHFSGDRNAIRHETVQVGLDMALEALRQAQSPH